MLIAERPLEIVGMLAPRCACSLSRIIVAHVDFHIANSWPHVKKESVNYPASMEIICVVFGPFH